MDTWRAEHWAVAADIAVIAALVSGVPTGVIPTAFYHRMTPVQWWDYPILGVTSVLFGLLAASYFRLGSAPIKTDGIGRGFAAGLMSTFAVGCPICNKVVVLLLGVSGALNYFAPVQPALGILGVALLLITLIVRLRGENTCGIVDRAA